MIRTEWTDTQITQAQNHVAAWTDKRLLQKGNGAFASQHEILGVVRSELTELDAAVSNHMTNDSVVHELTDIAVACILGIASIRGGHTDW